MLTSPLKREFILKGKGWIYNAGKKEPLAYFFESHEDLRDKVGLPISEGLVAESTYNNTDRYLLSETLVEYLLGSQEDTEDGSDADSEPRPAPV